MPYHVQGWVGITVGASLPLVVGSPLLLATYSCPLASTSHDQLFLTGKPAPSQPVNGPFNIVLQCALQNPPITFAMDDLGKVMELDAEVHRELAVFRQGSNSRRCCIVLPAMQPRNGLFSQPVRVGVVRVID